MIKVLEIIYSEFFGYGILPKLEKKTLDIMAEGNV